MITYDAPEAVSIYKIKEGSSYTFSDYFKLGFLPKAVAQYHGYQFKRGYIDLPNAEINQASVKAIGQRIHDMLPRLSSMNEMAKREFMIAPLITEVVLTTNADISTEFQLDVGDGLRGKLDYLIESEHNEIVIVEAKRDDMDNGFSQLTAELIAIDKWTRSEQTQIYGAVSVGQSWGFGMLDRATKMIYQDLTWYLVPQHAERIVSILTATLQIESSRQ